MFKNMSVTYSFEKDVHVGITCMEHADLMGKKWYVHGTMPPEWVQLTGLDNIESNYDLYQKVLCDVIHAALTICKVPVAIQVGKPLALMIFGWMYDFGHEPSYVMGSLGGGDRIEESHYKDNEQVIVIGR